MYRTAANAHVAVAVVALGNLLFDPVAACAAVLHDFPRILSNDRTFSLMILAVVVLFNTRFSQELRFA